MTNTITLYHGTTNEAAEQILKCGYIQSPAYFTPKEENAHDYGGYVFEIDIDIEKINVDTESYNSDDVQEALEDGASFFINERVMI